MEIVCPVKKTRWGPVTTKVEFVALIRTYGQFFGVDQSGPACNYNPTYPCDQSLYAYMGWGPHKGIDIPLNEDEAIFAVADGKCIRLSDSITQGLGIILKHKNLETVYWHNKENLIILGQEVKQGDLIAKADNTGFSSSTHLHFETRKTDDIGNFVNYVDPLTLISFEEVMTEQEVKQLQALEGYSDPEGVVYWAGKPLSAYLKARLPDKVKVIKESL